MLTRLYTYASIHTLIAGLLSPRTYSPAACPPAGREDVLTTLRPWAYQEGWGSIEHNGL